MKHVFTALEVPRWISPLLKGLLPLFILAGVLAGAYFLLWEVPRLQTVHVITEEAARQAAAENNLRATLAQIVLGFGIVVGLYLTYRRIKATERQATAAEDGQITERFTRAIEQLGRPGNEHTAIRLGGIYALERIMRDSESDAPTVQEVLSAFVRDAPIIRAEEALVDEDGASDFYVSEHTDVQAALSVLGRNPISNRQVDLRGAWLKEADLSGLHFEHARLEGGDLQKANLNGAHLKGAILKGVVAERARLRVADLEGANLERSILVGADLVGANLQTANLNGADLEMALLFGANLERAKLIQTNLKGAFLWNVRLVGAHLIGQKLKKASLQGANLSGALLPAADLEEANLSTANLNGANLRKANLKGANLEGANLEGADLEGANLTDALVENTILDTE